MSNFKKPVFTDKDINDDDIEDQTGSLLNNQNELKKKTFIRRLFPDKTKRELFLGTISALFLVACLITVITLSLTLNFKKDKVLILISIDGFRYDYLNKSEHPNLKSLYENGITAELAPSFPSLTFPNHYSIITGLYPESHGIVGNYFYDPDLNRTFGYNNATELVNPDWWIGKAFWEFLTSNNIKSAACFWPGSETKGRQPTYFVPYDDTFGNEARVEKVIEWLDLPQNKRPSFIVTYFSDVDSAGHNFGPDSEQVLTAIREIDRVIGILLKAIKDRSRRLETDIIIVSDHGMTPILEPVFIEDYIDLDKYIIPDMYIRSPHLSIWAPEGDIPDLLDNLKDIENAVAYDKSSIPERFNFRNSRRIAPLHIMADVGYELTTRESYEKFPRSFIGGDHGYDPDNRNMSGIFIGSGPSFIKSTIYNKKLPNVEIFNIMSAILHLDPPENNGTYPFIEGILNPDEYKIPNNTKPKEYNIVY